MVRALLVATITFGVALSYEAYEAKTAEACGVKLATKAPKVRRNTSSKNRSRILIVGKKDSSLEKQLRQKKHSVVYASSVDKVKDTKYHLVIADKNQFDAAQDRFTRSQVMQKRSSSADTSSSVERMLARRAKSSSKRRGALLASKRRRAVETGGNAGTGRTAAETGTEGGTAARTPAAGSRDRGLLSGRRPKTDVAVETGTDKPEPKVDPKPEPKVVKTDPKPKVDPKPDPKPRVKPDPKPDPKPRVAKDPVEKPAKNIKWAREFRFGTNSTNLSASSRRKLQRNAQWLEQNPGASITIEGHTDTVGDEAYNLDLSERRANVAKDFLLSLGIDESRITVEPKGEQEPAYQPGTSGKNRRIVLIKNN